MARLPRLYAPGIAQYVLQKAAAGRRFFDDADDYRLFVGLLADAARAQGVALHAYVLLPDEFRLLATPPAPTSLGRIVQAIGRVFAPHCNRRDGVAGPLWDRRFRSTLIGDGHVLAAMRHVERRPLRTGATDDVLAWRWSSLPHHVGESQQSFVADHRRYWSLSDTPFERQAIYRAYVTDADADDLDEMERLERAVMRGWAYGGAEADGDLATSANRRTEPLARGRPKRSVPI